MGRISYGPLEALTINELANEEASAPSMPAPLGLNKPRPKAISLPLYMRLHPPLSGGPHEKLSPVSPDCYLSVVTKFKIWSVSKVSAVLIE
jgi:hypothetical protein